MEAGLLHDTDMASRRAPWLVTESAWSTSCRTTRWSVVLAAATEGERARRALDALYRIYYRPVFAFIARRRGREAATVLAHDFIVDRMVEAHDLRLVQQRSGQRFRGWLFTALRHFLANRWKFERAQRRDVRLVDSWSGAEPSDAPNEPVLLASGHDQERQLERARALALLTEVLERLRHEYCAHAATAGVDGAARFDALKVFLPGPNAELADYTACAAQLGASADAVKQAVRRLRMRFADLLNQRLRQNVESDAEVVLARRALCQALELPAPPHPKG